MSWPEFVSSLIGAIAGSGIVGLVLQAYISNSFAKELEQFKTSLSAELFERQTRFAWLHTERSKTLVHLYGLLAVADKAFTNMLRPIQAGGEEATKTNIERTSKAANEFFDYYDEKRVFFGPELTGNLRQLENEYRKVWSTFVPHVGTVAHGLEWAAAWEKLSADVTPIRVEIEQQIQQMLGVETPPLG
jgi:hypothetical protein